MGEWKRTHNTKYFLLIKSKGMRWAGHVSRAKGKEVQRGFWWEDLGEKPWQTHVEMVR
jgi:hypothetical protein